MNRVLAAVAMLIVSMSAVGQVINGVPNQTITGSLPGLTSITTSGAGAGLFQAYNSAGTFYTAWSSAATANNTINGPGTVIANGHLVGCTTAGTVCTLTDEGAPGGGGLPTSTAGQIYYSSGTTGTATSAMLIGATAAANTGTGLGVAGIEILPAPLYFDTYGVTGAGSIVFSATCAIGTTASCAITGGTALDPNGGVVWAGVADGSNDGEWIKYTGATSTTITGMTRGYWGSAAAAHGSSVPILLVAQAWITSTTTAPYMIVLANGATFIGGLSSTNTNVIGNGQGLNLGNTLNVLSGAISFSNKGNNKDSLILTSAAFNATNDSDNATVALGGNNLQYSIATQTIATTATLTAITNAVTPTMPANGTTAAAGTGGVLSSHCHIIWSQATGGTVAFAVKASATPTRIDVTETDFSGAAGIASGSAVTQNITTTTTTLTSSGASNQITPAAFGTIYYSDITVTLNPGTSNNVNVALYAETSSSSDTLSLYSGTGCSGWN